MAKLMDAADRILYEEALDLPPVREEWRRFDREDFFESLRDEEFRLRFRFSKEGVLFIVNRLTPFLNVDERSHALAPVQKVLLTLAFLGDNGYQRTEALIVRCSQGSASNAISETLDALCQLKGEYLRFRSRQATQDSADFILERFGLPNFPYAIDGCHVYFKSQPRGIPDNSQPRDFINRKGRYSLNVQVIADASYRILDLDCRWPGSAHDARIWNASEAKQYLTNPARKWYIAGDGAYPLSPKLIKPFARTTVPLTPREKEFNRRLSGLRTFMSENVFGQWKRRFPVLDGMRMHHANAQKAILATAILHNMSISLGEESLSQDEPSLEDDSEENVELLNVPQSSREVYEAGVQERLRLLDAMPPITPEEMSRASRR